MTRDKDVMSSSDFVAATNQHVPKNGSATANAEKQARETGKLNPLVDPAGFNLIRRSLRRLDQRPDKLWELMVGFPVPIETWLDTTGSMGDNVDRGIEILPRTADLVVQVLPGCDPQLAICIFGDTQDKQFVICRPQFEMEPKKIVEQMTLMVPEKDGGGNGKEDPQYGLFASAYLTASYANQIGLLGYNFAISDEPVCTFVEANQLKRIFSETLYDRLAENGYEMTARRLPDTNEIVATLLKRAHAFFLQVGNRPDTKASWAEAYGCNRIVSLPSIELLPQVETVIIGLTESVFDLAGAQKFLRAHEVDSRNATRIIESLVDIPIGAQAALPNFGKRPMKGALFAKKTDLWPIDPNEVEEKTPKKKGGGKKSMWQL
jgi:hypothetical protein